MKYRYYFNAIQCNRWYSNFMRACDLGIDDVGVKKEISFTTDTEPTEENIKKIETLLNSSEKEKSLSSYFINVKLNRVEVVLNIIGGDAE